MSYPVPVTGLVSIFLYACESSTLIAKLEKRMQALEMRCYGRLLNILYKDHATLGGRKIQAAVREYDELLALVRKWKLRWFCHVSRSSGLAKMILQGIEKGKKEEVDIRRGGKAILKSGQEWTLPAQQGQLKTRQGGKALLHSCYCCCSLESDRSIFAV